MSRPSTPRRPSTAQKDVDRERMPFEAAEALLWGKETFNQHTALYGRMRELEDQHRAYDARIQATEAVSEAAEAATARIRHIEQQVAAIESDEHDRPFDKWVGAEIDSLKTFKDKNKNVRQNQIELDKRVDDLAESFDKSIGAPKLAEDLLRRIVRLENERTKDAGQIRQLEKDVTRLTMMRLDLPRKENSHAYKPTRRQTPGPMPLPTRQSNHGPFDVYDETEDEELLATDLPHRRDQAQIQVPRSPEFQSTTLNTALLPAPQTDRDNLSARLRILQRKSIQEPKRSRAHEEQPVQAPAVEKQSRLRKPLRPGLPPLRALKSSRDPYVVSPEPNLGLGHIPLPATQLVNKPISAKHTLGETTTRIHNPPPPTQLVVKLPLSKRKRDDNVLIPRQTRSQAQAQAETEKNSSTNFKTNVSNRAPASRNLVPLPETQLVDGPATKRQKPNQIPPTAPKARLNETSEVLESTQAVSNAADIVKTSPRKAAMATKRQSCNHCHRSKIPCDHARPVCGNCRNRPRGGACVYLKSVGNQGQLTTPALSSPQKTTPKVNAAAASRRVDDEFDDGFNSGFEIPQPETRAKPPMLKAQKAPGPRKTRIGQKNPSAPSYFGAANTRGQ